MGQSIAVTQANFQQVVLEPSFQQPVLIDFYATWCGPCKMLTPLLEKLRKEYDFTLAKVDIDQNPELANAFRVEGVPDVRVAVQGQLQEGFVGVLPEPQLRDMLAKFGFQSALEQELAAFQVAQTQSDPAMAQKLLRALLLKYPDNPQISLLAAQVYLQRGELELAEQYLDYISPQDRQLDDEVEGVRGLIEFHSAIEAIDGESPLDEPFVRGCQAALQGDYPAALETFLNLVQKDRTYRDDGARKAMLTVFKLLGDSDPLTITYRKRLMQTLY
jgi:putative thioredoxin